VLSILSQIPENIQIIEILHLEQAIDRLSVIWNKDFKIIETFVATAKLEMVHEKFFFNFFEVPHILVLKKYKKIDFELLKVFLMKVQRLYLIEKAKLFPEKPIEQIYLTEEDMVPLELLDVVVS